MLMRQSSPTQLKWWGEACHASSSSRLACDSGKDVATAAHFHADGLIITVDTLFRVSATAARTQNHVIIAFNARCM